MSEGNERDPRDEIAMGDEAVMGQIGQIQRMIRDNQPLITQIGQVQRLIRDNESLISQIQQVQRIIRDNEALRRQVLPIVQATKWFAQADGWPLPFPLWLANAMDAQIRELLSPRPAAHQRSAALNVNVAVTATAEVAVARGFAPSPTVIVSDGDVASASENRSVAELDSRRRVLAGLNGGQIFALVLVWLIVLAIPAAAWDANLPTEIQALVDVYDGVLANVAVAITFEILGKRNKR